MIALKKTVGGYDRYYYAGAGDTVVTTVSEASEAQKFETRAAAYRHARIMRLKNWIATKLTE